MFFQRLNVEKSELSTMHVKHLATAGPHPLNIYRKKKKLSTNYHQEDTSELKRTPPPNSFSAPLTDLNDSSSERKKISIPVGNDGKERRVIRAVPYLKFS